MVLKENNLPFEESVKRLQQNFGMDLKSAIDSAQDTYSRFKVRNQNLIEGQNRQSNAAQVQLISHFALLATLTLTVTGFLVTQTAQALTDNQKITILFILIFEVASLFFGAADYLQTILFHNRWAHLYQSIEKEVDEQIAKGKIRLTNEMNKIEARHLRRQPETTKMWITYTMVSLCLVGLLILVALFYAYFFDVPLVG